MKIDSALRAVKKCRATEKHVLRFLWTIKEGQIIRYYYGVNTLQDAMLGWDYVGKRIMHCGKPLSDTFGEDKH